MLVITTTTPAKRLVRRIAGTAALGAVAAAVLIVPPVFDTDHDGARIAGYAHDTSETIGHVCANWSTFSVRQQRDIAAYVTATALTAERDAAHYARPSVAALDKLRGKMSAACITTPDARVARVGIDLVRGR